MGRLKDLTGQRFSRLVVVKYAGSDNRGQTRWHCRCDCGTEKEIATRHLTSGGTKSCGLCNNKGGIIKGSEKRRKTRLYGIYCDMKKRCYNATSQDYHRYGGRGITVCEEWLNDFETFKVWAYANGYDDTKSIDRVDNDSLYAPENCRWGSKKLQANNTRRNRRITHDGLTLTLQEWSEKTGIGRSTLIYRLNSGWPIKKALTIR